MNGVELIDSILKDMKYIGLLLSDRKYVPPLNTFNRTVRKLEKLRTMLDTEYLTPEQIREAVRRLEKPIESDKIDYDIPSTTVGDDLLQPTSTGTFKRDSVGTEELSK